MCKKNCAKYEAKMVPIMKAQAKKKKTHSKNFFSYLIKSFLDFWVDYSQGEERL